MVWAISPNNMGCAKAMEGHGPASSQTASLRAATNPKSQPISSLRHVPPFPSATSFQSITQPGGTRARRTTRTGIGCTARGGLRGRRTRSAWPHESAAALPKEGSFGDGATFLLGLFECDPLVPWPNFGALSLWPWLPCSWCMFCQPLVGVGGRSFCGCPLSVLLGGGELKGNLFSTEWPPQLGSARVWFCFACLLVSQFFVWCTNFQPRRRPAHESGLLVVLKCGTAS